MDVKLYKENHTLTAVLTGQLSGNDAFSWYNVIADQLEDDVTRVVLNLDGVTYLTSASLRGVILLLKEMNLRDGELILEDPQDPVMEILELAGMAKFLDIRRTR